MQQNQQFRIYFILIAVMFVWGLNVTATKILVTSFLPVTITSLRIFTAGIAVFIILAFMKLLRLPTRKELAVIFIAGIFNVVCHHYFLAVGLTKTTASNTGLILGLGPLLSAILAALFLGNHFNLLRLAGFLAGLTGVAFIVLENGSGIGSISAGDFSIFLSVLTQSVSFILIKKASKTMDPRLITGYMLVFGALILFVISLIKEPGELGRLSDASIGMWGIFLASAVVATALGHMAYNSAISKVGVAESAIFINLSPFFSLIAAAVFLGETISASQLIGFLFILAGVFFGSGAYEELSAARKRVFIKKTR